MMIVTIIAVNTANIILRHCQRCRTRIKSSPVATQPTDQTGCAFVAYCDSCLNYVPFTCKYMLQLTVSHRGLNTSVLLFDDNVKSLFGCSVDQLDSAYREHGSLVATAIAGHLIGCLLDVDLRVQCRVAKPEFGEPDLIVESWEPVFTDMEDDALIPFALMHPELFVAKMGRP